MTGRLFQFIRVRRRRGVAAMAAALLIGAVCGCSGHARKADVAPAPAGREAATTTAPSQSTSAAYPAIDAPGLPNAHRVTAKVISGAQPEGDPAFAALQKLGVRTIISVDGAAPDVAAAKKFGLRYVHLPITYAGVTPAEGTAIAKAIDELPGPIYLHCHHGKHRSAAAVAVGCVKNGSLQPEQAETILKLFGTGENFKGLWQAAREARPLTSAELAAVKVDYASVRAIPPLAEAMVQIDERWDRLKADQKAGWKSHDGEGAKQFAADALVLEELFRERGRMDPARSKQPEFAGLLQEAEDHARQLRVSLSSPSPDWSAVNAAFAQSSQSCTKCHAKFRDK